MMSFESTPCPLPAKFSSVTPLYDRSLLSAASHNAVPLPLLVFNLGLSSQIELPTVNIHFPVRQGKKSSKYLNTNTILASIDSSSSSKSLLPHHRKQLKRAWAISPRVPTVDSRRAWAGTRNVSPVAVHSWFDQRKWRAKNYCQPIGEGTYELGVGNPNDGLDINDEPHPDTFFLSPVADSTFKTPSLVPHSPISFTNSLFSGPHRLHLLFLLCQYMSEEPCSQT